MITGPEKALLAILIITLMIGMGATMQMDALKQAVGNPKAIIIGILSQFGWMPLIAWGLAQGLQLDDHLALGLLIVGCTPGGTTSNLFAYLARADVTLSVAMTTASTLAAVVLMPLMLWLYSQSYTDANFALPLKDIATTLVIILLPVGIGMAIRARNAQAAKLVETIGSYSGIGVLILLIASGLYHNLAVFLAIPSAGYIAAIALGLIGMTLGLLAAKIAGLETKQAQAVSLETGIQNSPLAIGIIVATFPADMHDKMLWMPLLYALCVLLNAAWVSMLFRKTQ